jgi:hypothetical protein
VPRLSKFESTKQVRKALRAVSAVLFVGAFLLWVAGAWHSGAAVGATAAAISFPTFVPIL